MPPTPRDRSTPEGWIVYARTLYQTDRDKVRAGLELLRDPRSPCWQMTFESVENGWDVEIHRAHICFECDPIPKAKFGWAALDGKGLCLGGKQEEHTTPEAAWNAAIGAIARFLTEMLTFPAYPSPTYDAVPIPAHQHVVRVRGR